MYAPKTKGLAVTVVARNILEYVFIISLPPPWVPLPVDSPKLVFPAGRVCGCGPQKPTSAMVIKCREISQPALHMLWLTRR